jgi:hypothetical protein
MNNFSKASTQNTRVENTTQVSPKNEGVIIIRPSFMKFCEDGCRAALFNHILYWIAKKAKDQSSEAILSGEITYYATTDELTEHMAGAWGSKKVRLEVNALIEMGVIGLGRNPKFGADRTKHFFFGKEQCQKLLEFCQKHEINLFTIGLPADITELIRALGQFPKANGKSTKCPAEQMVNLPNANGKKAICSEHEQMVKRPFANGEFTTAITKVTTKVSNTKVSNERKNGTGQRKSDVAEKQESHSSIHPSSSSFQNSSQETKPEEVALTEEEQLVYELAKAKRLSYLKRDEKHKGYCAKLAREGVTSLEKIESLMQFCQQRSWLAGKDLNLKNLVNELNGWLQTQKSVVLVTPSETNVPPVRPAQVTNITEMLQMQAYLRYEDAQKERSVR